MLRSFFPNNTELIRLLVDHGADVNETDEEGLTPLHNAIQYKNCGIETIKLLIERGAEVNAVRRQTNRELIKLLLEQSAKIEVNLFENCCVIGDKYKKISIQKNTEIIKLLYYENNVIKALNINETEIEFSFKNCANINEKQDEYITHCYTERHVFDIVKLLIKHSANLNVKDNDFYTPFIASATKKGSFEMMKFLLEHGSDPFCSVKFTEISNGSYYYLNLGFMPDLKLKFWRRIIENLLKLKILNFTNDEQFSNYKLLDVYNTSEIKIFEESCKVEAEILQSELICLDRIVTLSDILTKSLQKVAVYLAAEEIKNWINEINFDEQFPFYSTIINEIIKKATNLTDLFNKSYYLINH